MSSQYSENFGNGEGPLPVGCYVERVRIHCTGEKIQQGIHRHSCENEASMSDMRNASTSFKAHVHSN
jgi:hypothetical protein